MRPDGGVGALSARANLAVHKRVQLGVVAGVFADDKGTISPRDLQLSAPIFVLNKPSTQLRITPGVSLPLGSAASGLEYTLLTTGSFDPTLGVQFATGSTWVLLTGVSTRLPLHPGFDRVRQGVYARGDLHLARRIGGGALSGGASLAAQQTRGFTSPGFTELAAVVNASMPLSDRWGLDVGLRAPVWTDPKPAPYLVALQVGLTHVIRKAETDH